MSYEYIYIFRIRKILDMLISVSRSLARVSATAPVSKTKWRLCEGGTFKRPGSCKRADLGGFFLASKATHVSSILNKVTIDGLFWGHILHS